jgi:hypothetical protein
MNFETDIEAKIMFLGLFSEGGKGAILKVMKSADVMKKAALVFVYVLVSLLFAAPTSATTAAGEAGAVGDASPCSSTVPFQIMVPGYTFPELLFVDNFDITYAPQHFRAFVAAVTEHVNSRLAREKLCINGAKSMESMRGFRENGLNYWSRQEEKTIGMNVAESMKSMREAERENRSLLQFVHWDIDMSHLAYTVPVMTFIGGRPSPSCWIGSPWIDLAVYRTPVPQIRGIVYWNERQLLVDQAVLDGARDVLLGRAMPLSDTGLAYYWSLDRDLQRFNSRKQLGQEIPPELAAQMAKPIKEHVPPELLWLFHRSEFGEFAIAMQEKGAEGYTKLVTALIDRCFASDEKKRFHYRNILDVADPVLLEQYKIDMPRRH